MKNFITTFILALLLISCGMNNENFIPEIQYIQIGDKTNVVLTLPDNLNKVIYEIDEPVFNSGVKCDYTHESPLSGNKSFENQQNFKIVNTSFVKLSDRTNVFYIYKNKNRVIVFREEFMVSGISDSEVIFNKDITKVIGENQVDNSDEKTLVFEAEDSFNKYNATKSVEIQKEDFSFKDYIVNENYISSKAKINYQSSSTSIEFRTIISETYNSKKVDFAGYYITIFWGCGMGCVSGVMVDVRDGKIYDLPLSEETVNYECYEDNNPEDDEGVIFKSFSRLFVTTKCSHSEIEGSNNIKQSQIYYLNIWNEQKKKFELIKKINKNL